MSQKENEWEEKLLDLIDDQEAGYMDFAKLIREILSTREKEIAEEVEKKRLLENLPSEYEIQGFLRAHQKTAVVAFNKALDEVLSILNE